MAHALRMLVLCFAFALPLVAAETFDQCLTNCPPGNNACSQCCSAQFDAATAPCYQSCNDQQRACFSAAYQACRNSSNFDWCMQQQSAPCQQAIFACQRVCDNTTRIAGGCPDEMLPQPCPFNCQGWNPASRSCVGAAMNMCPPPPPQKCPYNCQSWNPISQSCIGAAMNACGNLAAADAAPAAASVPLPATPPQVCSYDCQKWDPATMSCAGPARNGCEIALARAQEAAAKAADATKKMKKKK